MLSLIEQLLVLFAAVLGGAIGAWLGWMEKDPPEPFEGPKFMTSLVRSIIGGLIFAVGFQSKLDSVDLIVLVVVALSAGGFDVTWNRANKVRKKNNG